MKTEFNKFYVRIRTKNHTAKPLKKKVLANVRTVLRLGSITPTSEIFPRHFNNKIVEFNTVAAVKNSSSKLRMKDCFKELKVKQADWWKDYKSLPNKDSKIPFPILAKKVFGFKAKGMELIQDDKELKTFLEKHTDRVDYFFERFYNYAREYRLHVTKNGPFLVWRKLRKKDAKIRWFFNDSNCNWVSEKHELFDKPSNWKEIIKHSVNALKSTGLDIGAVDVRIQSGKKGKTPDFIVCEVNSAPSLGDVGVDSYLSEIEKLIKEKH